jgi:autotransporter-associated beta strand protein
MSGWSAARVLTASLVALLTAGSSLAQTTYTWTGGGPTTAWSDALNWSVTSGTGTPPPPSDLNNTLLVLAGNTQTTNVLDQNLSANRLTFDANAGSFVVGGSSTLTLGGGGIAIDGNNNQTVNANLAAGATTSWVNNGTGVFTAGGAVDLGSNVLTVAGAGNIVSSGAISGTGGLNKNGTGALTLTGNNTYTGQTNVLAGTLSVGSGGTIAGSSGVGVVGTGTLSIATGGSVAATVVVFGANARIEGTGTADLVSLGAIGGNGDPVGVIRAGINGVGTLTVGDLVFGTGATQSFRITTAGTPSGVNTGGSSGGTPGNPANNNNLHMTGSLIPYSLFNGGPDEFNTFRFIIDGTGAAFTPGQSYSYRVGQVDSNILGLVLGDVTIGPGAGEQAQFSTIGFAASDFSWTLTEGGAAYLNFTVAPVPEPATVLALAAGAFALGQLVRRCTLKSNSKNSGIARGGNG